MSTENLMIIAIAIITLAFVFNIYEIITKGKGKKITYPYEKAKVLTNNEIAFYKQLLPIADSLNLTIFPKVRIADILSIKKGTAKSEWQSAFNRIQSKHVDFVIVKRLTLDTVCVIELDDSSHDKQSAVKNDTFKNEAFKKVSLPIIRTRTIDGMRNKLQEIIPFH